MDYLSSVPDDRVFILGHKRLKNLYELLSCFKEISDETYSHFASNSHNYFADWIEHVIKYPDLADELRKTKTRHDAIIILENLLPKSSLPPSAEEKTVEEVASHIPKEEETDESDTALSADAKDITSVPAEIEKIEERPERITEEANSSQKVPERKNTMNIRETEALLKKISDNETQIKEFLWKHFAWDMAKEFMYGMAIGILIGLVVSKIFIKV